MLNPNRWCLKRVPKPESDRQSVQDVVNGRIVVGERLTGKTAGRRETTRVTRSPPDDMRTVSRYPDPLLDPAASGDL